MTSNLIVDRTFDFSVRIVRVYQYLTVEKREYVMSKQLLRCGTSIGANVAEAQRGQSNPDFASKMCIALKEASETEYWMKLLCRTEYLTVIQYKSLYRDLEDILRILTAICKKVNAL